MEAEARFQELKKRYFGNHTREWAEMVGASAQTFPDHPGIQAIWANHLLWTGELDQAKQIIESAAQIDPHHPDVLAVAGSILAFSGEDEKSAQSYASALDRDPTNFFALCNYPFILQKLGQPTLEKRWFSALEEAYPTEAKSVAMRSYAPLMAGDLKAVELLLNGYAGPESDAIFVARARLATRNNDWTTSEDMAKNAVRVNPECSAGWEHLCMIYRHQGRLREAKQAGEYAISINSRSVPALRELAKIHQLEGNKELAKQYEERADTASPIAKGIHKIGETSIRLMQSRNPKLLDQLMREIPTLNGMERSTRITGLLQFFETEPNHPRCAEFLGLAKPIEPENVDLIILEAAHFRITDRPVEAIAQLHAGLQKHPRAPGLLCEQVANYAATGQTDLAKSAAQALIEVGLSSPFLFHKAVLPLVDAGLVEEAQTLYDQLKHRYPDSDATKQMEMVISLANGDFAKGVQAFAKIGRGANKSLWKTLLKLFLLRPYLVIKVILIRLGIVKRK